MSKILIFLLNFILFSSSAYAYFDPGTGMFIIQGIIAIFGVVVFYLGYPIRLLKSLMNKLKKKSKSCHDK